MPASRIPMKNAKASGFEGERSIVVPDPIIADLVRAEIADALYVACIGFYPHARYHYRERRTGAAEHILIYCVDGCGWYELEGSRHEVAKNQFFILPKGVEHRYAADGEDPWTIYWVHFGGTRAREIVAMLEARYEQPRDIVFHAERISLFDDLFEVLSMGYSRENLIYASMCLWHFLGSVAFPDQFSLIRNVGEETNIEKLIYFMKRNLTEQFSLARLAAAAGLSRTHLSVRFKKTTGYSPLQYFSQLKIQRACQYLDHTDMEVKEISAALGFSDPLYFSRVFAKLMKVSPKQYRARKKG